MVAAKTDTKAPEPEKKPTPKSAPAKPEAKVEAPKPEPKKEEPKVVKVKVLDPFAQTGQVDTSGTSGMTDGEVVAASSVAFGLPIQGQQ